MCVVRDPHDERASADKWAQCGYLNSKDASEATVPTEAESSQSSKQNEKKDVTVWDGVSPTKSVILEFC